MELGEILGRDRFLMALHDGIPDRVPIFLRDLTLGLDLVGYSTPEVCGGNYDPVKSSQAVISAQRRFHQDAVVGCIHSVGVEAKALGGEVRLPERGIPSIVHHPLAPGTDFDLCDLPDVTRDPLYQGVLASYGMVSERLYGKAAVVCNLEGPMTKAALLRGLEPFALDLQEDPGLANELVKLSISLSEQFLEDACKMGAEVLFIAAATDNPDILGKLAFLDQTIPGLRRLAGRAAQLGMPCIFHPHGIFSGPDMRLLKTCLASGIRGFQFAEGNDPVPLKRSCQGRACLLGGIDAFSTLLLGPASQIEAETKGFIDICAPGGGYVYMCSCSLHRGMPLANVDAMVDSCLRHGAYPSNSHSDTEKGMN